MSERTSNLIGGLSGIISLVLSIGGFTLLGTAGFALSPGASIEEVTEAIKAAPTVAAFAGVYLDTLGSLFFIVFGASLWATLRRAEGDPAWLSTIALAAVLLSIAASLGDKAAYHAILIRVGQGLDAGVAATLFDIAGASFNLFRAFSALFLAAVALVVLRTNVFPRWLGWTAVVIAVISLAASAVPASDISQVAFPLFPLWIIAVSVFMIVRRRAVQGG